MANGVAGESEVVDRALTLIHRFGKELFWIRTNARLLEKGSGDAQRLRRLATIREISEDMEASAASFLRDCAAAQASPKASVRLGALVTAAIKHTLVLNEGASVLVEISPSASQALVDKRLEGVLLDLFDNAIRASADAPRIRVFDIPDESTLCVEDQGIGMHPEAVTRCTDIGFTTRKDGHGVGLSVARKLLAELGGALVVRSRLDRGTTVELRMTEW